MVWGAQAGAGVDERAGAQGPELGVERLGGGHDHVVDLVDRLSAGFERRAPGDAQHPDRLHQAVAGLGHSGGFAAERGPSRGFGVDGVGLAAAPSRLAVGAVHLHHADALAGEAARQAGAVAAGALHADAHQLAPGSQPGEQFAIAGARRRERFGAQQAPRRIDGGGDVVVAVGVHAADDFNRLLGHNDAALLRAHRTGMGTAGRDGGQDTHGA